MSSMEKARSPNETSAAIHEKTFVEKSTFQSFVSVKATSSSEQRKEYYQMNELIAFNSVDFGTVRTVVRNNEPWFVASDVCQILEIKNNRDAMERLDDDEKDKDIFTTSAGNREFTIVSEPGLYGLVLGSRKPEAKAFRRWIVHEVVPSIRQHGIYATPDTLDKIIADPEFGIRLLTELKDVRAKNAALQTAITEKEEQIAEQTKCIAAKDEHIAVLEPKGAYYDIILQCPDLVSISIIAKDYGWSPQKMNKKLCELKVQYKQGKLYLLYQKYAECGYTSTKTIANPDKKGEMHSHMHTYWTQSGRKFIYDLLKEDGVLPTVEQSVSA